MQDLIQMKAYVGDVI